MAFSFGDWAYGMTDADYQEVAELLPDDIVNSLERYEGQEGTYWIIAPGMEDMLSDALDEEGYLDYYSTFRYCGSGFGFGKVG